MSKLSHNDLERLAETTNRLGLILAGDRGQRIRQSIAAASSVGMPAKASGTPGQPHNPVDEDGQPVAPDTATERAALNPDPTATRARWHNQLLVTYARMSEFVLEAVSAYDPERAVALCTRCQHPMTGARCTNLVDGRTCGASEEVTYCANRGCDVVLEPGKSAGGRCETCRKFWQRNQRDRVTTKGLDLGADVLTEDGVAHV